MWVPDVGAMMYDGVSGGEEGLWGYSLRVKEGDGRERISPPLYI